jgi:DNA-binding transcriptional LysR family regulator
VHLGQLDVAAVMLPPLTALPDGVVGENVGPQRMVVVVPKHHAARRRSSLDELAQYSWVMYPERCLCRAALQRAFEARGHSFQVAVSEFGVEQQLALVAAGAGLGFAPEAMLWTSRFREKLRPVRIDGLDMRFDIWVVRPQFPGTFLAPVHCITEVVARRFGSLRDGRGSPSAAAQRHSDTRGGDGSA